MSAGDKRCGAKSIREEARERGGWGDGNLTGGAFLEEET